MPSDRDLERLVRAACPVVSPSAALRARVLSRAARPAKRGRILRLVLPYAAGVLTAFAAERALAGGGGAPASRAAIATSPSIGFESIADRNAPAAPAAPAPRPEPAAEPAPVVVAYAPIPRIS